MKKDVGIIAKLQKKKKTNLKAILTKKRKKLLNTRRIKMRLKTNTDTDEAEVVW